MARDDRIFTHARLATLAPGQPGLGVIENGAILVRDGDRVRLVEYNARRSFARIGVLLDEVIANFPSRMAAFLLRTVTAPRSAGRGPSDALTERCAALISAPGPVRDRLSADLTVPGQHPGVAALNEAFARTIATDGLRKRLRELDMTPQAALQAGLLTPEEKTRLDDLAAAVSKVIAVDDFSPEEMAALYPQASAGSGRMNPSKEAAE